MGYGDGSVLWPGNSGGGPPAHPPLLTMYATGYGGFSDTASSLYIDGALAVTGADFTAGRAFPGVPLGNSVVTIPLAFRTGRVVTLQYSVAHGGGYYGGVDNSYMYLYSEAITGWNDGVPILGGTHTATDADNAWYGHPVTAALTAPAGVMLYGPTPLYFDPQGSPPRFGIAATVVGASTINAIWTVLAY